MNQEHVQELQDVRHPLLGRFGRRNAAHGDAFLRHLGAHGQRHLDLSGLPRRDSCAAGNRGRSIGLPGPFRRTARHQPRRLLRRTGSDESRGAQSQPPLAQKRERRSSSTAIRSPKPICARPVSRPTIRSQNWELDGHNLVVPGITTMTREALKELELDNKSVVKCKNMFALGICFYLFHRPERPRQEVPRLEIRTQKPAHRRGQQTGYRRGLQLRSQYPPVRQHLCRAGRTARKGHLPLDQRQRRHGMGTDGRRRKGGATALLRLLPHHAGHGDSRRAGQAQGAGREDRAGRRRDRRHLHGHRRRLRRQFRRHDDLRPGTFAQKRSARSGRHGRTAAGGGRRPARRPVDGSADQDRTERPDAGALRPQRRVSRGGARSLDARRLLPFRFRSGQDRHGAHDARDPAHRRIHRQRFAAVRASRR